MNRFGFLLGLFATGSQVLLLRELLAAFHGSELFVGTALFGWLVWVALGAYWGGRTHTGFRPETLFAVGSVMLPLAVIGTRLLPVLVTDVSGETIPFTTSALLSSVAMLPAGFLSGWLFPAIAWSDADAHHSIVVVYFYEGLGAFTGGFGITLVVGEIVSALSAAGWLGVVVCGSLVLPRRARRIELPLLTGVLLVVVMLAGGDRAIDRWAERVKYPGYQLLETFDTHYGRQTLLSREGHTVLFTDNLIEAQTPDPGAAEIKLLPPLLYRPGAQTVLYVGRPEFGVATLMDSLPELLLTAVDPREVLTTRLEGLGFGAGRTVRVTSDPVRFLAGDRLRESYDIVILDLGTLDTYAASRFLTPETLGRVRTVVGEDGLLYLITPYDTERYTTPEVRTILSLVRAGLNEVFQSVVVWPGTSTLFFAGADDLPSIAGESLQVALHSLPFQPQYLDSYRLADMLNDFRRGRLYDEIPPSAAGHTLDRPVLTTLHATYRSSRVRLDRYLMQAIISNPWWLVALPLLLLAGLVWRIRRTGQRRWFGLWLYFAAGAISLAYELLSFYVFQCTVGSLYSQLALLVGTFMLGLSMGAWYSARADRPGFEYPALATLLLAGLIFLLTHELVNPRVALLYHMLFLLTTALATGSLFAAATRRYYGDAPQANRGSGYAVELGGSGLSALLVTTILLPLIGLTWVVVACLLTVAVLLTTGYLTRGSP